MSKKIDFVYKHLNLNENTCKYKWIHWKKIIIYISIFISSQKSKRRLGFKLNRNNFIDKYSNLKSNETIIFVMI